MFLGPMSFMSVRTIRHDAARRATATISLLVLRWAPAVTGTRSKWARAGGAHGSAWALIPLSRASELRVQRPHLIKVARQLHGRRLLKHGARERRQQLRPKGRATRRWTPD